MISVIPFELRIIPTDDMNEHSHSTDSFALSLSFAIVDILYPYGLSKRALDFLLSLQNRSILWQ